MLERFRRAGLGAILLGLRWQTASRGERHSHRRRTAPRHDPALQHFGRPQRQYRASTASQTVRRTYHKVARLRGPRHRRRQPEFSLTDGNRPTLSDHRPPGDAPNTADQRKADYRIVARHLWGGDRAATWRHRAFRLMGIALRARLFRPDARGRRSLLSRVASSLGFPASIGRSRPRQT
jgi:hypothetical protein